MTNEDLERDEVTKLSLIIRGRILNEVSMLEIMIDAFLANHFCDNEITKRHFLKHIMNSKIVSLENKRVTLKKIVEESYPNFSIEIPKYYTRIEKIIKLRNSFAHHQVDITPIGIKLAKTTKNIIMIDSSKDVIQYNTDEIEKSIADIVEIRKNLAKMNMKNI